MAFVRTDIVYLYTTDLMNAVNNFDKTDREYSPAPVDDLVRFWRSKVKVTHNRTLR